MKTLYIALTSLLLSLSYDVSANPAPYCNNCTSVQMESTARSLGNGEHVIVDLHRQVAKKYLVIIDDLGGIEINTVIPQELSPNEVAIFAQAISAKENLERTIRDFSSTPVDGVDSAWDLSGNSRNQNLIAEAIRAESGLFTHLYAYLTSMAEVTGLIPNSVWTLTYNFPNNNGFARYEITGIINGEIQLRIVLAIDGDFNTVPLTKSLFEGEYTFTTATDFRGFSNANRSWGGTLIVSGVIFNDSGDGTITTDCIEVQENIIECTANQD